jgi:hypothetical protein
MSETSTEPEPATPDNSPRRSFMVIAALALIWNLLGVMAYVMQVTMSETALQALPENERLLFESIPIWATSAFAIAVNGGALGSLLLLFRKVWALPVLAISLLGVIVQMYHSFFIAKSMDVYGPGSMIMPGMIIIISIYLVWYSWSTKTKGWIS